MIKSRVAILIAALSLSACATSPKTFYADPTNPDDTSLCRAAFDPQSTPDFRKDVEDELVRRGMSGEKCRSKISMQNGVLVAAAVIGTGAAVVAACRNGCSGGGGYSPSYVSMGAYGYAWDEFYDEYGQLTWRCRDRANGEFADNWHCPGPQVDSTWPSKGRLF